MLQRTMADTIWRFPVFNTPIRLCVCLSACVSHAGIVSKRLNVGSRNATW